MKNLIKNLVLAASCFLLFSCSNMSSRGGSIRLVLPGGNSSRSVDSSITDQITSFEVALCNVPEELMYIFSVDNDDENEIDWQKYGELIDGAPATRAKPGSSVEFDNLDEGYYYVSITAYAEIEKKEVNCGFGCVDIPVKVVGGQTTPVSIKLRINTTVFPQEEKDIVDLGKYKWTALFTSADDSSKSYVVNPASSTKITAGTYDVKLFSSDVGTDNPEILIAANNWTKTSLTFEDSVSENTGTGSVDTGSTGGTGTINTGSTGTIIGSADTGSNTGTIDLDSTGGISNIGGSATVPSTNPVQTASSVEIENLSGGWRITIPEGVSEFVLVGTYLETKDRFFEAKIIVCPAEEKDPEPAVPEDPTGDANVSVAEGYAKILLTVNGSPVEDGAEILVGEPPVEVNFTLESNVANVQMITWSANDGTELSRGGFDDYTINDIRTCGWIVPGKNTVYCKIETVDGKILVASVSFTVAE